MQGYTPLFNEIVDSSLWGEPLHVRVVFLTLMSMKDWDHVVRLPIHKVARKANVGDDLFLDAMRILAEPDRLTTIEQPHEGRRISKVDGGWLVLNGEFYQKLMQELNQKARWAKLKREQRARVALAKGHPSPGETNYVNAEKSGATPEQLDRLVESASAAGGKTETL